jgi:protein SCO1/2
MKINRFLPILVALAIIILLGAALYFLRPHTFHGTVFQSPEEANNFTLNVADGKTVNLSDYRGKIVLVYFGYTFCPDVCPATLGRGDAGAETTRRQSR